MPRRKASIAVSSRSDSAKTANVILARRLASGNINGGGNREIPLKEKDRWYTRIDNTLLNESHFYDMVHRFGYQPLTADDLACTPEQAGFRVNESGYLVRGARGEEMAFKMSKEDRAMLDQARTAANLKGIGSQKTIKDDMAEAASSHLGAEAADYIDGLDGKVVDEIVGAN